MKTLMINFSHTGHTRFVAEHMAAGIRDGGSACELVPLSGIKVHALTDYDLVAWDVRCFITRNFSMCGILSRPCPDYKSMKKIISGAVSTKKTVRSGVSEWMRFCL